MGLERRRAAAATHSRGVTPGRARSALVANTATPNAATAHPRKSCACGGGCPRCTATPALALGLSDDRHEQRADRLAARVANPRAALGSASIDKLRDSDAKSGLVDERVGARIAALGSGGPLPGVTRRFFERRLAADLSAVRVHVGSEPAALNRALGARAFTVGQHVAFGDGAYRPESVSGRQLLAHELVHTLQQRGAPPRVQRVPLVANMRWPIDHSDVASGNDVDLLGAAILDLGASPELARSYAALAARRSQWGSRSGLYVRAVDFLRDHRGRFETVGTIGALLQRVYTYCDSSSATLTTLSDTFYTQLLSFAVYSPELGAATMYHHSLGGSFAIPGRSASATDFAPSGRASLLRPSPQPNTTVSGGFSATTDLLVSYGSQSGSVALASVRLMLGRYSASIPSPLRSRLEELATDPTIFSVLQRFLADDNGRFLVQPVGMGGAHYTSARPPSIEVDSDLFPGSGSSRMLTELALRTTLAHELYHYALDRSDAMLTEVGRVDDHNLIQVVEDRYRIVETIRAGLTPVSSSIAALQGWVGGDPKPALNDFIRRNDHAGLRSYVGRQAFLESLTYTMLMGPVSGNQLALQSGNLQDFLFDPAQITDLAYLAAINAVILRKAFEVAAYTAEHQRTPLATTWTHSYYTARMQSFIQRLVGLASQNRTRGIVDLASQL